MNDCLVLAGSWNPTFSTVIVTESPGWASTRAGPAEATVPTYTWRASPARVTYQYFCPPVMSQPVCAIVPVTVWTWPPGPGRCRQPRSTGARDEEPPGRLRLAG